MEYAKMIYKTRTAVIKLLVEDILHYDILENAEVDLDDAEESIEIQKKFAQGNPIYNLTDIRKVKSISIQASGRLKANDVHDFMWAADPDYLRHWSFPDSCKRSRYQSDG